MASSTIEITLINYLDAYADALPDAADDLAALVAQAVAVAASAEAPKRTGALAESAYVVRSDGTTSYAEATGRARGRNAKVGIQAPAMPPPRGQALVAFAATHAAPIHEGRALPSGGTVPANQFLQRAIDDARSSFDDRAAQQFGALLIARARGAGGA